MVDREEADRVEDDSRRIASVGVAKGGCPEESGVGREEWPFADLKSNLYTNREPSLQSAQLASRSGSLQASAYGGVAGAARADEEAEVLHPLLSDTNIYVHQLAGGVPAWDQQDTELGIAKQTAADRL